MSKCSQCGEDKTTAPLWLMVAFIGCGLIGVVTILKAVTSHHVAIWEWCTGHPFESLGIVAFVAVVLYALGRADDPIS